MPGRAAAGLLPFAAGLEFPLRPGLGRRAAPAVAGRVGAPPLSAVLGFAPLGLASLPPPPDPPLSIAARFSSSASRRFCFSSAAAARLAASLAMSCTRPFHMWPDAFVPDEWR